MSQTLGKIFGIDLGTTYSCIAYVDDYGKAVIIPNFDNLPTTPSVVYFENENRIVGEEAKKVSALYPEKVASFVKRSMGDPNFVFSHNGVDYKPEEISSFILQKLVQDAQEKLGMEIKDVVITCPAYFGINEREATKLAGELAGLNVKAIINEPTAAAIAYGMDSKTDEVVLVYDLGGGTFDITMIELTPESIEVIVTGGDNNLGGKDWDHATRLWFAESFVEETGSSEDILGNRETLNELQLLAENTKKSLTVREKVSNTVSHDGEKARVELTRAKFDAISNGLLSRTISMTHDMLAEAKKKGYEHFDEILLVGGSSKMPQVKSRLEAEFKVPITLYDPDEAVAKGAAIYGMHWALNDDLIRRLEEKTGRKVLDINSMDKAEIESVQKEQAVDYSLTLGTVKGASKKITNVTSKSFGVIAYDQFDVQILSNLVLKNTTVPVNVTKRFGTRDTDQPSVDLQIFENESGDDSVKPENGKEIGTAKLELPRNLPAGSPIDITFCLNAEGRLDITAVEVTDRRKVEISIETSSLMSAEEVNSAKKRREGMIISGG